jgi:hypothetical protein
LENLSSRLIECCIPVYVVEAHWHDERITITAVGLACNLLGMSMLHGSTLFIDVIEAGRVVIEPRRTRLEPAKETP